MWSTQWLLLCNTCTKVTRTKQTWKEKCIARSRLNNWISTLVKTSVKFYVNFNKFWWYFSNSCLMAAFIMDYVLSLTLKMTTAQVSETSVTVNNNSPIQDYVHPDDHTEPTYEMTPGVKPFTVFRYLVSHLRNIRNQSHPYIHWLEIRKEKRVTDLKLSALTNRVNWETRWNIWIHEFSWI